jgi:hypothetical protein
VLADPIPPQLDVDAASIAASAGSATWNEADRTIQWQGDLGVGQTVVVTFDATISNQTMPELAVINLASLDAANGEATVYGGAVTEITGFLKYYMPFLPN